MSMIYFDKPKIQYYSRGHILIISKAYYMSSANWDIILLLFDLWEQLPRCDMGSTTLKT